MLRLNWLLMVGSSLAAVEVLRHHVDPASLPLLVFNFANRSRRRECLSVAFAFSVWGHDRLPCVFGLSESAILWTTRLFASSSVLAPPLSCRMQHGYGALATF